MPYKDKDKERERCRKKALKQYQKNKNDPEWYNKKLEYNQKYAEHHRQEQRDRIKERKKIHKQKCLERLGGKCVVCGTTENLEFDHIDKTTKKFKITNGLSYSLEKLYEEVDKCQLLCKKHHIEKSISHKDYRRNSN